MSVQSRPTQCPYCHDDQLRELSRVEDEVLFACMAHGHEFTWTDAENDHAQRRVYDGHTIVIDGPVWTDADRDELAKAIKISMCKEIDLHISDHRIAVLAVALLRGGWKRTVRP